ncbi:MAG: 4Fe-4S binding protein [Verrucomicrobiae bacterium]|nr:4Fe-4S binding protein [Verrucomicrobiae bacterium]
MRAILLMAVLLGGWAALECGAGELRFPPPDFESGHVMPETEYPSARAAAWAWVDVAVLLGALGWATWLVHRGRSRRGVVWVSVFSVLYFGFFREGCVCAIGSVQNVALALGGHGYALPVTVGMFFAAPLVFALFFGRTFCAAVCPHGALQDLVLVRPVRVPRWLESGLGLVPYLFLGAGVAFAATGAAFVICRLDPFIPIFRTSGGMGMVVTGGVLLAVGMFVGRPYCRFLCPYGALLRVVSALSKWRVRVTPDVCTSCRLCPEACPYDAIREADPVPARPAVLGQARRRVVGWLVGLPLLMAAGALLGGWAGGAASRLDPTVRLMALRAEVLGGGTTDGWRHSDRLALERADREADELNLQAAQTRERFRTAGIGFGVWSGLVVGWRLISLGMVRRRTEFEPDRAACVACARCFESCPQERIRLGLAPEPVSVAMTPRVLPGSVVPGSKAGGCGCGGTP